MQCKAIVAAATTCLLTMPAHGQALDWTSAEAVAAAAVDSHPALITIDARARAAAERIRVAGSYPNPMLMAGVQDQQIDLSRDEMMTMYMIGAAQTIPRRERRDALRQSAQLDVLALQLEAASVREEIRRDALFAWYDLAATDSKITATEQLAAALDAVVAAARFRYEAGTTIQADVIRAQLQRSTIDHQLLSLGGERRIAAARLLAQLGLTLTTEIPRLHLPDATEGRAIESAPVISNDHPALAAVANEVADREQQVRLARLIAKPDWNIEASYGMRPEEKDMFSVIARVELPVRRSSVIEPQIRAAIAERDAAAQRLEVFRRQLLEALGVAYSEHADATRQLRLHEEVLVPQARLAFESSLAAYQTGKDVFEAVVNSEATWLALEINYFDLLRRHIKAITDFEAIQRGARGSALAGMASSATPSMNQTTTTARSAGMSGMR